MRLILLFCFGVLLHCSAAAQQHTVSAKQDWGNLGINRSVDGNDLSIASVPYRTGLGTHSFSEIRISNIESYSRFTAFVGIDSESGTKGTVRFMVQLDGKEVFRSPALKGSDAALPISIELNGAKTIALLVDDGGDDIDIDHADWAEAKLIDASGKALEISSLFKDTIISLETKNSEYTLGYTHRKKLLFLYYGDPTNLSEELLYRSPAPAEEYPGYGVKGQLFPSIRIARQNGDRSVDLYVADYTSETVSEGVRHHVVTLQDTVYPLSVRLHYLVYYENDVIVKWTEITNGAKEPVVLKDFFSGQIKLRASNYYLTHLYGTWGTEFNLDEDELAIGRTVLESRIGHTSNRAAPCFMVTLDTPPSEESGTVIFGGIAWSGNWMLDFNRQFNNDLVIGAGINSYDSEVKLSAGETFVTPKLIYGITNGGKGEASRILHRFLRGQILPDGNTERKIVLNSWEAAYFDFTTEKLKTMINAAAEIGTELFVIDDGWFGTKYPRNNDDAGLGDWKVNTNKLEGGLQPLIDYVHAKNMNFGIWIEPEMVNPESELYKAHPDWIIALPSRDLAQQRNQYILDFSNPEVVDAIYTQLAELLSTHKGINYIKWDYNRWVSEPGSYSLPPDEQTEMWIGKTTGFYTLFERLRKAFPEIVFQTCSSGGGRIDFEVLRFASEFWASDNTDPYQRLFIQHGASLFFPALTMACHVSTTPNHTTASTTPLSFRFAVSMNGRLGMELDPAKLSPEDMKIAADYFAYYKKIRSIVQFGDLYRLRSPYKTNQPANLFVSGGGKSAVLFVFQVVGRVLQPIERIRLRGLHPDANYLVKENIFDPKMQGHSSESGKVFTGAYLMSQGLLVEMYANFDSAILEITEQ